jgi:hypothetical protein
MGITGGIKEILVSLSEFFMSPISELCFNMAAIIAFYRIKYENSDEFFDEKDEKKEKDPISSDLSY